MMVEMQETDTRYVSRGIDGVLITLSVGIGRNILEAEQALLSAKRFKGDGRRYNIEVYAGEPLDCPCFQPSPAAEGYLRLESLLMELSDADGLEDLEMLKFDPKTGLLNRTGYETEVLRLRQRGGYGERCFILLDGDNMKQVNSSFGYGVTDSYLVAVGAALKGCVRQVHEDGSEVRDLDMLVNRKNDSGGDEFVIDVGCDYVHAEDIARRCIDSVYDAQARLSMKCAEDEIDTLSGSVWVDVSSL
ncbi:diguanylate cyclase [Candidatus Woesearchaeota archaeon]|nr:diguanylate cyclase [Candidatus Woesearchaeota archaeon]